VILTVFKPKNQNRNEENRRQIIDFIADNGISDSKSISKAIGLWSSSTSHQVPQPNNALFLVHKIKNIALFLVHETKSIALF
jgi:hypothetical protein